MITASSLPLTLSESEFLSTVLDYAHWRQWLVSHFRPAQTPRGRYVTALQGDPGCPDLILARDGAVLLAELKTQHGPIRPAQKKWLAAAGGSGRLWRPSDWPQILEELR